MAERVSLLSGTAMILDIARFAFCCELVPGVLVTSPVPFGGWG
jgi:hypothetical protein